MDLDWTGSFQLNPFHTLLIRHITMCGMSIERGRAGVGGWSVVFSHTVSFYGEQWRPIVNSCTCEWGGGGGGG